MLEVDGDVLKLDLRTAGQLARGEIDLSEINGLTKENVKAIRLLQSWWKSNA